MSYEVLARKWRPLLFDDVVGQDHITVTLKKAVETGRISHAYMLAGPRGCGKTSTARILARVINCENPPGDGNPCNECGSCRAVIRGNNLDVLEIDGASHTGVNEVRDLQESIGYAPSQYRNKVYIIDEVHMLSTQAFNAFLKTLEEPPGHVYFIFATTLPGKILDTVKSRCQRYYFKRLEINDIERQLRAICEAEDVKYTNEGLRLLARKADGSLRDGTSLLDQCITSSGKDISTESVRDILGLIDQERLFEFMKSIAGGDPTRALRLLDASVDEGLDIQELCSALLEGYRDLMLLAAPGDLSDLLFLSKDEVGLLRELLPAYELPDLVTVVERLCNAVPALKSASDPRIVLESLLVDLALLERQVDIRRLIADLEDPAGGGRTGGTGTEKTKRTTTARATGGKGKSEGHPDERAGSARVVDAGDDAGFPVLSAVRDEQDADPAVVAGAEGALDVEKLGKLWDGFVTFVRQKRVSLGVCLISGKVYSFDGETVTLRFAKSFGLQKDQVDKPDNIRFLRKMMKKYFGCDVGVRCYLEGDEPPGLGKEEGNTVLSADKMRGIPDDKKPAVKKLLDEFNGEIIRYNP